jgi:3-methyladenine DNA glycosylase AlkC
MENAAVKDVINKQSVSALATRITKVYPEFQSRKFINEVCKALPTQSLSERLQQVRVSLYDYLPKSYPKAVRILLKSLPPRLTDNTVEGTDLAGANGFITVSLTSYVARYGIDDFDRSMKALKEMTKRFSSEGSIRFFIQKYEKECLALFHEWAADKDVHVRRLVSECTRPRLPWAMALPAFKKNPRPVLKLLEKLKDDPELYVRRSVANNLNDISKDNPDLAIKTLKKWSKKKSPDRQWLVRHALRTLERQGHPDALEILGFSTKSPVKVKAFTIARKRITMGQALDIAAVIETTSKTPVPVLIDYVVYHQKANGTLTPKVFKWTKRTVSASAPLELKKSHLFKPITTRKYYSGAHEVHIQVNGKKSNSQKFELIV